jgi:hypothetical protein
MLSVDMVGYGPRALAVFYDGTTDEAAGMLDACGGATGPSAVEARGDISDHEAFANYGTPSALLWRPDNPDYHGAGDTEVVQDHLVSSLFSASLFISCGTGIGSPRSVVHHLQADLLARRADVGGASFFVSRIRRGDTGGDVGRALLTSPEWSSVIAPVARVYLAAFGRHADHGGLVHWTGLRRAGAPLESIASAFTGSPEFAARNGAPDTRGFVRLLYRNVLGRDADQAGEDYWVGEVDRGAMSRAGVLVSFSESPEHRFSTASALPVALAYAGLLRRTVDPDGLAYWSTRPLEELIDGLLGSAEFQARFA